MKKNRQYLVYCLCLLCLLADTAGAQQDPAQQKKAQSPVAPPAGDDPKGRMITSPGIRDVYYEITGYTPTGLDNTEATVAWQTHKIGYKHPHFSVEYARSFFQWDKVEQLPLGNGQVPWNELHSLRIGLNYQGRVPASRWAYAVGAGIRFSWEKQMTDSHYVNGYGALIYAVDREWQVGLGAWAFARPGGKGLVLPTPSISWRQYYPAGFSATVGLPVTEIRYRFGPEFALHLGGAYDVDSIRLADDNPVEPRGYVNVGGAVAGLYANWSPVPDLKIFAGPQFQFLRFLNVNKQDGKERSSYTIDPAFGASLRLTYTF